MCFVQTSEQTVTFALYTISRLGLYNREVFTEWYALSSYIKETCFSFKVLCVSCICYFPAHRVYV